MTAFQLLLFFHCLRFHSLFLQLHISVVFWLCILPLCFYPGNWHYANIIYDRIIPLLLIWVTKMLFKMKKEKKKRGMVPDALHRTIKWLERLYCIVSHLKWILLYFAIHYTLSLHLIHLSCLEYISVLKWRIAEIILIRIPTVRTRQYCQR